jgi:hypothetical protein
VLVSWQNRLRCGSRRARHSYAPGMEGGRFAMTRSKEGIQGTVTRKSAVVLLAVDNQGLQDELRNE